MLWPGVVVLDVVVYDTEYWLISVSRADVVYRAVWLTHCGCTWKHRSQLSQRCITNVGHVNMTITHGVARSCSLHGALGPPGRVIRRPCPRSSAARPVPLRSHRITANWEQSRSWEQCPQQTVAGHTDNSTTISTDTRLHNVIIKSHINTLLINTL